MSATAHKLTPVDIAAHLLLSSSNYRTFISGSYRPAGIFENYLTNFYSGLSASAFVPDWWRVEKLFFFERRFWRFIFKPFAHRLPQPYPLPPIEAGDLPVDVKNNRFDFAFIKMVKKTKSMFNSLFFDRISPALHKKVPDFSTRYLRFWRSNLAH